MVAYSNEKLYLSGEALAKTAEGDIRAVCSGHVPLLCLIKQQCPVTQLVYS